MAAGPMARAVVCEDDPTLRRVIESVLRNVDVEVIADSDSVPSVMDVITHGRPDVVVLDLIVLGTSTFTESLDEVRRIAALAPVVVFSAHDGLRAQALEAGARAFVDKPDFDALGEAVVQVVTAQQ